jgi:hypothetical protein
MTVKARLKARSPSWGGGDAQRDPVEQGEAGHGHDDEDDLHRQPSLFAPVHVLQEHDEGELVQHQRHADAQQCGSAGRPA